MKNYILNTSLHVLRNFPTLLQIFPQSSTFPHTSKFSHSFKISPTFLQIFPTFLQNFPHTPPFFPTPSNFPTLPYFPHTASNFPTLFHRRDGTYRIGSPGCGVGSSGGRTQLPTPRPLPTQAPICHQVPNPVPGGMYWCHLAFWM